MVLDTILGGAKGMSLWGGGTSNRSSRLYKALVETELASDADCAISSTVDPYLFSFSATVRQGRTLAEVEAAMLAEIQRVVDEPVSDGELQKAIKQTKAQFAYSSESVTDQGYWLGFSELVADIGWFEDFLERIEAVTVEDVQRVAQTYLKPTPAQRGLVHARRIARRPAMPGSPVTIWRRSSRWWRVRSNEPDKVSPAAGTALRRPARCSLPP